MTYATGKISKDGFLSRTDLAGRYDKTVMTIKAWEARGMPVHHRDPGARGACWYKAEDVDKWYQENELKGDSLTVEHRKKLADALLGEAKVKRITGESISAEKAIQLFSQELAVIRAKLLNLPSSIAPHIYVDSLPARIKIVEEAVDHILQEIMLDNISPEDLSKSAGWSAED